MRDSKHDRPNIIRTQGQPRGPLVASKHRAQQSCATASRLQLSGRCPTHTTTTSQLWQRRSKTVRPANCMHLWHEPVPAHAQREEYEKKKVTKQHILKQGSKSSTNKNPATPKSTTGSPTRDSRNHVLLRPLSKGRPLSRSSHHRRLRGNYDAHSCVRHLERGPPSGNSFYFCVQRTWSSRNLHCHWSPCCHPYQGLFDRY